MTPLDPLFMNQMVEEIKNQNPEFELEIDTISARGFKPSIQFVVKYEHRENAEQKIRKTYEDNRNNEEWIQNALVTAMNTIGEQNQTMKEMAKSIGEDKQGSPINICNSQFSNTSIGSNYGTQTWNDRLQQVEKSASLDDETKEWLKSVISELQSLDLEKGKETAILSDVAQIQNELEKKSSDKNVVERLWGSIVGNVPAVDKIVSLGEKLVKIGDKLGSWLG